MSTLPATSIFKRATGWGIAFSILLIVLGVLAIALPLIAAIAVTSVVAWLMIFGGLMHLSVAFSSRGQARSSGSCWFRLLTSSPAATWFFIP